MRPTTSALAFLVLPLLLGCGGAKLVLKSPVESRCTAAGLQGCPELTEGVLLYVEGDKAKGKEQLTHGAAQNAPEKVQKFAAAIRELKDIPGASSHMKPLLEVADILASAKGSAKAGGKRKKGRGVVQDSEAEAYADDDGAGRTEGGTVTPATAPGHMACGGVPGFAACVAVTRGPLVITDLVTGDGCPSEVVAVAARSIDRVTGIRWVVRTPHGLDGERGFVRPEESLYVGVPATAGTDPRCTLTWSGFRPNR